MKEKTDSHINSLLERYPELATCRHSIIEVFNIIRDCYQAGGKVLVCGNGGSAADAEHICGELMKGFLKKRPLDNALKEKIHRLDAERGLYIGEHLQQGLPAIPLYNIGLFTAFINDVVADLVYAQQVVGLGKPGDVLWGISTSGNAKNVFYALITARAIGLKTVGLTGEKGGKMAGACDAVIKVPSNCTPDIQEYHLPVYHCLCKMLEEEFFEI